MWSTDGTTSHMVAHERLETSLFQVAIVQGIKIKGPENWSLECLQRKNYSRDQKSEFFIVHSTQPTFRGTEKLVP